MSNGGPQVVTAGKVRNSASYKTARTRRRAKDLNASALCEVKRGFEIKRNTLEVAQDYLMPRSEAVDAVLIRFVEDFRSLRSELSELRRQLGIDSPRPFLVRAA